MEWVETTGRTVDEAKSFALEQLGVGEADAEFEVVAEPKIGLFGRLKEEARVRARVQPRYPRSKGERRERRRNRGANAADQTAAAAPASPAHQQQDEPVRSRSGPKRQKPDDKPAQPASAEATPQANPVQPSPAQAGTQASSTRRRRRTGGPAAMTDRAEQESSSTNEVPAKSAQEQARMAEDFLRGLLTELGATATVGSTDQANGIIEVAISGDGLGTLIGPKGTTLLALQELTRIYLQRHTGPSDSRIVVDINAYRRRRQEALTRFAQQIAGEVVVNKARRALEPMPPADRKVVHDAVNAVEGVTTISQGEEPYRRVVLIPVDLADGGETASSADRDSGGRAEPESVSP